MHIYCCMLLFLLLFVSILIINAYYCNGIGCLNINWISLWCSVSQQWNFKTQTAAGGLNSNSSLIFISYSSAALSGSSLHEHYFSSSSCYFLKLLCNEWLLIRVSDWCWSAVVTHLLQLIGRSDSCNQWAVTIASPCPLLFLLLIIRPPSPLLSSPLLSFLVPLSPPPSSCPSSSLFASPHLVGQASCLATAVLSPPRSRLWYCGCVRWERWVKKRWMIGNRKRYNKGWRDVKKRETKG